MKPILLILATTLALLIPSYSQENRIWTYAKTGSTCEGFLQWKSPDGTEVQIKRKDNGRVLTVKTEMLIEEDQVQIKAWQAPAATAKEANPTSSPPDGSRQAAIQKKLATIIIPKVDFESPSLYEAIDFLRLRCAELDLITIEPSQKGINFVITRPPSLNLPRIKQIRLSNIPASTLIRYIADQVAMKVVIKEYFVELVPHDTADALELDAELNGVTAAAANIIIPRTSIEDTRLDLVVDHFNITIKEITKGKNMPIIILDATAEKTALISELRVRSVSALALVSYIASSTNHKVIAEGNTLRITKK